MNIWKSVEQTMQFWHILQEIVGKWGNFTYFWTFLCKNPVFLPHLPIFLGLGNEGRISLTGW